MKRQDQTALNDMQHLEEQLRSALNIFADVADGRDGIGDELSGEDQREALLLSYELISVLGDLIAVRTRHHLKGQPVHKCGTLETRCREILENYETQLRALADYDLTYTNSDRRRVITN